ncbi:hypothetical protein SAMN04487820_10884 [Actinopolyspora mzabensis]|uniref:Uncharacterized protein n=1 Tax=Actinopolyspora mzabensis TaxID=995066 RepID=A0A1G9C2X0_ACTMZ|nr:hypothetical protein [Actinopolyspora mzabensis]SDK46049.1 hypothetical protein SAMN04487820_10884 [Actinopolyspora mzabensis]
MVDSGDWKIQDSVHRDAKVFREVLEGEDRTAFEREFRGALWEVTEDGLLRRRDEHGVHRETDSGLRVDGCWRSTESSGRK